MFNIPLIFYPYGVIQPELAGLKPLGQIALTNRPALNAPSSTLAIASSIPRPTAESTTSLANQYPFQIPRYWEEIANQRKKADSAVAQTKKFNDSPAIIPQPPRGALAETTKPAKLGRPSKHALLELKERYMEFKRSNPRGLDKEFANDNGMSERTWYRFKKQISELG